MWLNWRKLKCQVNRTPKVRQPLGCVDYLLFGSGGYFGGCFVMAGVLLWRVFCYGSDSVGGLFC